MKWIRHGLVATIAAALWLATATLQAETGLEAGQREARAGNLEAAVVAYRQAVASEPRSALAHTRLGGMLLLRQQHAESIRHFKTAIGLDPANGDAFVGLGMAYLHRGQYSLARAAFSETLRLKPARKKDIDPVLAWLDTRDGEPATVTHH
jgi:tetratricopeptide (TPR) repeat protein